MLASKSSLQSSSEKREESSSDSWKTGIAPKSVFIEIAPKRWSLENINSSREGWSSASELIALNLLISLGIFLGTKRGELKTSSSFF